MSSQIDHHQNALDQQALEKAALNQQALEQQALEQQALEQQALELNDSELDDPELDDLDSELDELLNADDTPPEAFYLALKQALTQLEHHNESVVAA